MANARMRLKELKDKIPCAAIEWVTSGHGLDNTQPPFTTRVTVRVATTTHYFGESGVEHTKKEAEEAAAQAALNNAGNPQTYQQTRATAWLGDAAQELVLALLGTRAALSADQLDDLSQQLLSNDALTALAEQQLVSMTVTATEEEARFGRRLLQDLDILLEILVPALVDANPKLYNALVNSVEQAAKP